MKLYDVKEVSDAEQKAGDLFFNAFRCKIPADPHHFVLEIKTHEGLELAVMFITKNINAGNSSAVV